MSGTRVPGGSRINRGRPLNFTFEGRARRGYEGDTLASALLAAGVGMVGRSFKYHRPRGLMAAGVEEPNALIQLEAGARSDPNPRATEVELYDGLKARAVNCWPNLGFDVGAVNGFVGRFIPAGFYYKTFMWPDWHLFEPLIRRAAGIGRPSSEPDPDRYETCFAHCDVLVVGSGPAGLAAALAAGRSGARVILAEQDPHLGGGLLWEGGEIEGVPAASWAVRAVDALSRLQDVTVLTRTTAAGYFDHNALVLSERVADHLGPDRPAHLPRQRLWQVRARQVVLATGAFERPLVFPGNDRPGVMLASAVRRYLGAYGVLAGRRAVIFTNNDSAYATAKALLDAGGEVAALVDVRAAPPPLRAEELRARGVRLFAQASVTRTWGRRGLRAVEVHDHQGRAHRVPADLLAMSGGWNPTIHLHCQSGGTPVWDADQAFFRPGRSVQAEQSAGAAAGRLELSDALDDGAAAGLAAAAACGLATTARSDAPTCSAVKAEAPIAPFWRGEGRGLAFVDFQNDVAVKDIDLAVRENYISVEHLKRYTTLGMAPDQGKTSNVNALAIMAEATGRSIPETGVTRFRFPFTPMTFGALGGRARGMLFRPLRHMPAQDRHVAAGAVLEDFGGWARPAVYPRRGETHDAAVEREALAVRNGVGLFDASPLGKIEIKGPDAAEFLDRIYANTMSTLKVGRARYGLMLNEMGVLIDDGVTLRLADDSFLLGTTGAGAERILNWIEDWRQCEWPDLQVLVAPVTTSWAVLTLSGPNARAVLETVGADFALDRDSFPHMSWREGRVADLPARVARVSFTGELSYEVSVPASRAGAFWDQLMGAGAAYGIAPVGIDAWNLLRTEKGFLHVGADTDGTTTPDDIGWGHVLKRKRDFVGRRSLTRPDNLRPDRLQLVGLEALDSAAALPIGAHVVAKSGCGSQGYVTSAGFSPILGRGVALGMLQGGRARLGELVDVAAPDGPRRVRITAPGAYDPEGARLDV